MKRRRISGGSLGSTAALSMRQPYGATRSSVRTSTQPCAPCRMGSRVGGMMDRFLAALEATGYRPQKGSDTAFNQAFQKQLGTGKTPVGQAASDVVSSAALGGAFGGLHGAAGGAFVGLRRGIGDAVTHARIMGNSAAVARMLFDPAMAPNLEALARTSPGSKSADDLAQGLLLLARAMGMQGREPRPAGR